MQKMHFLSRLSLFSFGCTTTRAAHQPLAQPQPQPHLPLTPAPVVVPRGELLFMGLMVLAIAGLLIFVFKDNKVKGKKRR